jgi:hypothetical protein
MEANVVGAPGTELSIITGAGRAARVGIDRSGIGRLRWTTDGADRGFARVEVRRSARARLRSMVALTNPVWWCREPVPLGSETRGSRIP